MDLGGVAVAVLMFVVATCVLAFRARLAPIFIRSSGHRPTDDRVRKQGLGLVGFAGFIVCIGIGILVAALR